MSWREKRRNIKQPTKMVKTVNNLILLGELETVGKQLPTKTQNKEKSKTKTLTESNWILI